MNSEQYTILPLNESLLDWALILQKYVGGEINQDYKSSVGSKIRNSKTNLVIIIGERERDSYSYVIFNKDSQTHENCTLKVYIRDKKIKQIINDTES